MLPLRGSPGQGVALGRRNRRDVTTRIDKTKLWFNDWMMGSRLRWTIALGLLLTTALFAGARPACRWWLRRDRESRTAACRTARNNQRWDELQRIAAEWA